MVGIMKHHLYNARDERRVEWILVLRGGGPEESDSLLSFSFDSNGSYKILMDPLNCGIPLHFVGF